MPDDFFPLNSATPTQIEERALKAPKSPVEKSPAAGRAKPPRKPRLTINFSQRITLVKFLESRLLTRETPDHKGATHYYAKGDSDEQATAAFNASSAFKVNPSILKYTRTEAFGLLADNPQNDALNEKRRSTRTDLKFLLTSLEDLSRRISVLELAIKDKDLT